jgi:hypothetical protein
VASPFEEKAGQFLKDPWEARNQYVQVVLDRTPENVGKFFDTHAVRNLDQPEKTVVLKLLELQRHCMLMYTSCGWFFDELSGIETVQVIQYAGRVIQLAEELFGKSYESGFLEVLQRAKSNLPQLQDGRVIYEKFVKPAMVDLKKVGAHYAISSLFENYGDQAKVFCYTVERQDYRLLPTGKARLALGRAKISSDITGESQDLSFGVLHLGDHNLSGGIREFQGEEAYQDLVKKITETFNRGDLPEFVRVVDRHFGSETYSLKFLFRDEQRKILRQILEGTLQEAETTYCQLYEHHSSLMRFLVEAGIPVPKAFLPAAEFALNTGLRKNLTRDEPDLVRISALFEEARLAGVNLDGDGLGFALQQTVERAMEKFSAHPEQLNILKNLETLVGLSDKLPSRVNFWRTQNIFYDLLQRVYPEFKQRAAQDGPDAAEWVDRFGSLAAELSVSID